MTTFSFYSFRIFKISPYINFKKILDSILAPPSGRRPGADAPPCPPLATPLALTSVYILLVIMLHRRAKLGKTQGGCSLAEGYIYSQDLTKGVLHYFYNFHEI